MWVCSEAWRGCTAVAGSRGRCVSSPSARSVAFHSVTPCTSQSRGLARAPSPSRVLSCFIHFTRLVWPSQALYAAVFLVVSQHIPTTRTNRRTLQHTRATPLKHAIMVLGSPSASTTARLVYWSGADADSPSSGSSSAHPGRVGEEETNDRDHDGKSMYVAVFEGAPRNYERASRVVHAPNRV